MTQIETLNRSRQRALILVDSQPHEESPPVGPVISSNDASPLLSIIVLMRPQNEKIRVVLLPDLSFLLLILAGVMQKVIVLHRDMMPVRPVSNELAAIQTIRKHEIDQVAQGVAVDSIRLRLYVIAFEVGGVLGSLQEATVGSVFGKPEPALACRYSPWNEDPLRSYEAKRVPLKILI